MRRKLYYYGGLLIFIAGIAMLIFTIVEIPKNVFCYVISAICLIMGFFIVFTVYISKEKSFSDEENIDDIINCIDRENPTVHESIILDLKENSLNTKLNVSNYIVSDCENIYLEIKEERLFHIMICADFVEIESFDPTFEKEIAELENAIKEDPSSTKKNEKRIFSLMKKKGEKAIYMKHDISSKTKEEIINLLESNIL